MAEKERDITFEVKEHLGVIDKFPTGWTKELNLISWNGQAPKFDIRDWSPNHERMSRGITLHHRELKKIVDLFLNSSNNQMFSDKSKDKGYRNQTQGEGEDADGAPNVGDFVKVGEDVPLN